MWAQPGPRAGALRPVTTRRVDFATQSPPGPVHHGFSARKPVQNNVSQALSTKLWIRDYNKYTDIQHWIQFHTTRSSLAYSRQHFYCSVWDIMPAQVQITGVWFADAFPDPSRSLQIPTALWSGATTCVLIVLEIAPDCCCDRESRIIRKTYPLKSTKWGILVLISLI